MTREEFNKTGFGAHMKCEYMGEEYSIGAVNFQEALLALKDYEYTDEDYIWVRCESIKLL